jgi:hypothetical protein
MTATRWWVRLFARWQARIDSVTAQIQAASLAVTAFSTFSLLLQQSGYGDFIPFLGVIAAVGGPLYAYLYFEGGVQNQVARDREDMANNFADPNMRITTELFARASQAAENNERLSASEREAIQNELDAAFREYRDGIDIEDPAAGEADPARPVAGESD